MVNILKYFLLIGILYTPIFAQVTEGETILRKKVADTTIGWKTGGVVAITGSQTSLTNWAAGGENSISINSLFSAFANYRDGKGAWDNMLDIGYGLMKQGFNNDVPFTKTDDKFDLVSKYGYQAYGKWYYAALFSFKTQMTPGFKKPTDTVMISNFLAPAYLLGAIGMDYKPSNYISLFIAPITTKLTIVNDSSLSAAGAFGVQAGEKMRGEYGGYLRLIFSKNDFTEPFLQNISLTTKLDLYSNYLNNPEYIDVNWETMFAMKVNKYITVNLTTHLIYDFDIKFPTDTQGVEKDKVQFKEIFGVGFSYKF